MKDKALQSSYVQTASEFIDECRKNLISIQQYIKEKSVNLSPVKLQFANNIELHINSLKKYLDKIRNVLGLIKENFNVGKTIAITSPTIIKKDPSL